jgi:hypothetical protein
MLTASRLVASHEHRRKPVLEGPITEDLLKTRVLPDSTRIAGYRGGYVLRGDAADEVELVVINLFDKFSMSRSGVSYRGDGVAAARNAALPSVSTTDGGYDL